MKRKEAGFYSVMVAMMIGVLVLVALPSPGTQEAIAPPTCARVNSTTHCTTDVFQLAPGASGVITVQYRFESSGNASFVDGLGCVYPKWNNTGCGSQPYSITPSPTSSHHAAGQNVTVSYTVRSANNGSGVYWFYLGFCADVGPLVIGSVPSPLVAPGIGVCPPLSMMGLGGLSGEAVTGVAGMTVSRVDYQLRD